MFRLTLLSQPFSCFYFCCACPACIIGVGHTQGRVLVMKQRSLGAKLIQLLLCADKQFDKLQLYATLCTTLILIILLVGLQTVGSFTSASAATLTPMPNAQGVD